MASNEKVVPLHRNLKRLQDEFNRLQSSGRDVTSFPVSDNADLTDAKLAAVEARTDTKFAELRGEIATMRSDLLGEIKAIHAAVDAKPSRWDLWGAIIALFAAMLAVLAFGSDRLSMGIGLADQRQEQLARDAAQNATMQSVDDKLDRLLNSSTPEAGFTSKR